MKNPFQKIYLTSKSPRRRELLPQIDVDFELMLLRDQTPRGPDVGEEVLQDEAPQAYSARVTIEKIRPAQHAGAPDPGRRHHRYDK